MPKGIYPRKHRPLPELFWEKVDKTATCWLWTGNINHAGYGRFNYLGKRIMAHRVSYELVVGPIPEGLQIDHLCRVRNCVNPSHLEPVTNAENVRRGISVPPFAVINRAKTYCPQNHPYDEVNTEFRPSGRRRCRACSRAYAARKYAEKKAP